MTPNEAKILSTSLKTAQTCVNTALKLAVVAPDNVRADIGAALAYIESAMQHTQAAADTQAMKEQANG